MYGYCIQKIIIQKRKHPLLTECADNHVGFLSRRVAVFTGISSSLHMSILPVTVMLNRMGEHKPKNRSHIHFGLAYQQNLNLQEGLTYFAQYSMMT